ncbi:unnamed protein product [Spirodela intermedia]|uniref:Uncharacterized protein n=1 Tax=Spirodela intermedia TaxID=51605 RepID=A0A7I8JXV2_SPIIN|nr:unnamed protein product [Spirodela intermedia]
MIVFLSGINNCFNFHIIGDGHL